MKLRYAGLLAAVVAVVMAFAGSASATTLTSPTGTAGTPTVHAVNEGAHVVIDSPIGEIKCAWTLEGTVSQHGSGVTAKVPLSNVTLNNCTEDWHVTVPSKGSLEIHWTSSYNGTVTSSGMTISATVAGISCVYGTVNTHIGTLTGGSPATLHLGGKLPIHLSESSPFCGTQANSLTGSLSTTAALYVDQ